MKIKLADGTEMRISEYEMQQLAEYLQRLCEAAFAEREACSKTWKQSKADYENEPYPWLSKIVDGWDDLPFPFAFPRAEALSDYTVTGIVTQSPMVTCLLYGDAEEQVAENRQKTMDAALRRGKIEERLKTISAACWWSNAGILRVSPGDPDRPDVPVKFDTICPEDFIIVGSGAYDIATSVMVGHRFQRSRGDIKRRILAGEYGDIETKELPTDGVSMSSHSDAEMVELYQVYPWLDIKQWDDENDEPEITKGERRWSVVFEPETATILYIEEYPYTTPCYFAFGYKAAPERGFWHPRPIAAEMQGPHRAYQCMGNLALGGVGMSAFPPMAANKGAFSRDQRYGMGELIDMEGGDLQVPQIRFDLGAVQAELGRIERVGDGVARINAAGIGQEAQQSKTATQSNNEAAGMRAGIGGFIETFSGPLAEMCEHVEEILTRTFEVWKPVHGKQMPVEHPDEFKVPAKWDVPGKIPNLNPQAVLANAQTLMGMISSIFEMMQVGGPMVLDMGISLLRSAMNAMDWPNAEKVLAPLEGAMSEQEQGLEDPGLGGGPPEQAGMEAVLAALGGAGGEMQPAMPPAFP